MRQRVADQPSVEFRRLGQTELSRVAEIDRSERINVLYDQHGTQLIARRGDWSASAWDPDGHGEHSVEAKVRELQHHVDHGGVALGALASGRLVGIGVVVPHLQPGIAQLAFLHVRAPLRATGIGSRLSEQLEQIARTVGDSDMVVSATPSENTVRFYLGRGFQPMAEPLAELFELEPEDVHMRKILSRRSLCDAWTRHRNRVDAHGIPPVDRLGAGGYDATTSGASSATHLEQRRRVGKPCAGSARRHEPHHRPSQASPFPGQALCWTT